MPGSDTWIAFIFAVLAMQTIPGPDMLLVIGRGIGQGRRIAILTALGFTLAGAIQLPLLVIGIASIIAASPIALEILRYVGGAYLIWIGINLIIKSFFFKSVDAKEVDCVSTYEALRQGLLANLLNPKVIVFMLTFLPIFADPSRGPIWLQILILGIAMKICGLLVNGSVALVSGWAGSWLMKNPIIRIWQERAAGIVMVVLGSTLILEGKI